MEDITTIQTVFFVFYCQQMVLRDSVPVIMVVSRCSCVAGTAMCNHTVALLFQAHYSQLGVPVVPPVHSCTELEQQWHKPRTAVSLTLFNFAFAFNFETFLTFDVTLKSVTCTLPLVFKFTGCKTRTSWRDGSDQACTRSDAERRITVSTGELMQ